MSEKRKQYDCICGAEQTGECHATYCIEHNEKDYGVEAEDDIFQLKNLTP